jgi:preprotein translocase subunit SecA
VVLRCGSAQFAGGGPALVFSLRLTQAGSKDTVLVGRARNVVQATKLTAGEDMPHFRVTLSGPPESRPADGGSAVLAECMVRDYFRGYQAIGGLTATAERAAAQLQQWYGLEVTPIPASTKHVGQDFTDTWYRTGDSQLAALVALAVRHHDLGQPVLIRARSADQAEQVSGRLSQSGLTHVVLASAEDPNTARVIADAGRMGAVTVIVGEAGRGYGLHLGGDVSHAARAWLLDSSGAADRDTPAEISQGLDIARKGVRAGIAADRDAVIAAGGLVVLGASRSESGRADQWLRGLAGQRGEPGESRFLAANADYGVGELPTRWLKDLQDRRPAVIDESLTGRFLQGNVEDLYRYTEEVLLENASQMAVFDSPMDELRRDAYAIRDRLLESRDADEIIAWLSGEGGTAYSEQSLRNTTARRTEELGPAVLHELLRETALREFDRLWSEHLTRLREMYGNIPDDHKRAVAKASVAFQRLAEDDLSRLLADVKYATTRVLIGTRAELPAALPDARPQAADSQGDSGSSAVLGRPAHAVGCLERESCIKGLCYFQSSGAEARAFGVVAG